MKRSFISCLVLPSFHPTLKLQTKNFLIHCETDLSYYRTLPCHNPNHRCRSVSYTSLFPLWEILEHAHSLKRLLSKKVSFLSLLLSQSAAWSATKSENYLPKKHSRLDLPKKHRRLDLNYFLNREVLWRTGTEGSDARH